jgi:hypothetical protein
MTVAQKFREIGGDGGIVNRGAASLFPSTLIRGVILPRAALANYQRARQLRLKGAQMSCRLPGWEQAGWVRSRASHPLNLKV